MLNNTPMVSIEFGTKCIGRLTNLINILQSTEPEPVILKKLESILIHLYILVDDLTMNDKRSIKKLIM